ncbi:transposase [Bacillus sp. FJAT-45066]|uniref:transposase n=1 Tax=Bacillus sp. FJAT-45066 TaxID=2011010 RepID=UPI000BB8D2BF|nr:transposase [Bacillus sp. FJAT-45066]
MPREAREKSKTGIYHIMLRGINRQTIFEDNEDKKRFLTTLAKYRDVSNFQLYGYCLMDNHVHLLMKEVEEPIALTIQRISASYVLWYNHKYCRCGHLFQERFKSENVEDKKYFLVVLRYIHQNPIKAGLASNVKDCHWTSIKQYMSHPTFIHTDFVLKLFSSNRQEALTLFMQYMSKPNQDQCLEYEEIIKLSDEEVRKCLRELGAASSSELQRMDRPKRNRILVRMKKMKGVSLRQLARVTGISKSLIQKVK